MILLRPTIIVIRDLFTCDNYQKIEISSFQAWVQFGREESKIKNLSLSERFKTELLYRKRIILKIIGLNKDPAVTYQISDAC